ncbi:hypothetical protein [Gluconobacter cadivus]|uniref:Uncharacterized protein n=1 Tax=Gluconobacter cadivus TaxID=2728101 RepID=A0ABR9YU59_9PROT|nr:hypothetical protein [Gluconobacter cadivus]MBF0888053.1 hypothetical protein [Gluconobacter cadivus]
MSDIDTNYVLGTKLCGTSPLLGLMTTTTNPVGLIQQDNFAKLADTRAVSYWLNSGGATLLSEGWADGTGTSDSTTSNADVNAYIAQAQATGVQVIEADLNPWFTPSVPVADYGYATEGQLTSNAIFYKPGSDTATIPGGKTTQTLWARGLRPSIVFLNINFNSDFQAPTATSNHSDAFVSAAQSAISDIPKYLTSVRQVVPFLFVGYNPGQHSSSFDPLVEFAQDPYYQNDRSFYKSAGAISIDSPPSMTMGRLNGGRFVGDRIAPYLPDAYLRFIAGEAIWAKQNGIAVYYFASPFQQDSTGTPQYGYDTLFHENTVALARYLAAHAISGVNALPNYWMIGQYSNSALSNSIGRETDYESISSVMLEMSSAAFTDRNHVNTTVDALMAAPGGKCPTVASFAGVQSGNPTMVRIQGSAPSVASASRYGINDVEDGLLISDQGGLKFPDSVYDNSQSANQSVATVKGMADPNGNRGLFWTTRQFEEYGDGYHIDTYGAGFNGYNADGTPKIDPTDINAMIRATYFGGHFGFYFFARNIMTQALDISRDRANFNVPVQLPSYPKAAILGDATPVDGMVINDIDDHVPVIYENGKWYPIQLGAALQ